MRFLLPLFPALLACFKIVNGDIGFHVATGRAIEMLGAVPSTNVLSFTQPDHPWILHQWIPALLFHRVDAWFGPAGLVIAKCVVIYWTFFFLWLAIERRSRSLPLALLWFALATGAAACRFFVRPFIFSALGLAVALWCLAVYLDTGRKRWLLTCAPVAAVANMLHVGGVDILLLLGALAGASISASPRRFGVVWPCVALVSAAGLSTLAVLVESPGGIEALALPFQFASNAYYHEHLVEYHPLPFDLTLYPFAWILLGTGVVLGFSSTWTAAIQATRGPSLTACPEQSRRVGVRCREHDSISNEKGVPRPLVVLLFEFFAFVLFAYLALRHQRMVLDFALVAGFVVAGWDGWVAGSVGRRAALRAGAVALAGAVGLSAGMLQFSHGRFGLGVDDRYYPARLLDFVAEKSLPDNAYVSDAWGGHWLWKFYPGRRVFYDPRLEAYSFRFFLTTYQAIRYGEPGWQEKLDEHGVNTLLLRYTTPGERKFQEGRPNLRQLALLSPGWTLVFWDDLGEVLVRTEWVERNCPDCMRLGAYDPDRLAPAARARRADAEAEMEKVWSVAPSARACAGLAMLRLDEGDVPAAAGLLRDGLARFPDDPLLEELAMEIGND